MAVINCTPDSFHADSRAASADQALEHALRSLHEGAHVLDIGGESTRPGAERVDADEQIRRVVPVIEQLRRQAGPAARALISVDTTSSKVARAALDAGADAINDVSGGLDDPDLFSVAAKYRAGLIVMHRLIAPPADSYSDAYQAPPQYDNVVEAVIDRLHASTRAACEAGLDASRILWDPGLGFGKGLADTLELLAATPRLAGQGFGLVSALSRKSFVGRLSLGRDSEPSERLAGTLAMSTLHLSMGARIFRVHDVAPHREALNAAWAVLTGRSHPAT